MRYCVISGVCLALSSAGVARPPVYTGTAGMVDMLATDISGSDTDSAAFAPGPSSFAIGAGASTPGGTTDIGGTIGATIAPTIMTLSGGVMGGSGVGGAVSGVISGDIYFTLTTALWGSFSAGFLVPDFHPLLAGLISLSGPNAASVALGTHVFDAGDYHLHGDLSFVGVLAPPDTSGHIEFGAVIDFLPMPAPAAMAGAALLGVCAIRRRR